MKWLVSLSLVGAVLGGVYPGAFIAFIWAAGSGGEFHCFILNALLGVSGAFIGMLIATVIQNQTTFRREHVIVPLVLGLLFGIIGFFWADWAISHADPPL